MFVTWYRNFVCCIYGNFGKEKKNLYTVLFFSQFFFIFVSGNIILDMMQLSEDKSSRIDEIIRMFRSTRASDREVVRGPFEAMMVSIIFEDRWDANRAIYQGRDRPDTLYDQAMRSIARQVWVLFWDPARAICDLPGRHRVNVLRPLTNQVFMQGWYACESCRTPFSMASDTIEFRSIGLQTDSRLLGILRRDSRLREAPEVRSIGIQTDPMFKGCPNISRREAAHNVEDWVSRLRRRPLLFFRIDGYAGCYNCGSEEHRLVECDEPLGVLCHGCGTRGVPGENCPFCHPELYDGLEPPERYLKRLRERQTRYRRD